MLTDEQYKLLCHQVMTHDSSCVERLYDLYGSALYTQIFNIVKSEEPSVELLQDTFVKIWSKGSTYDPDEGRLYTWMLRIARNGALNYVNSKSSRNAHKTQGTENLVYMSDDSREVYQQDALDLPKCMNQIDVKYQEVLSYVYLKGYTQKEVSDKLNIPLGTVKSRVKIGLRELRKIYEYRATEVASALMILLNSIS